MILGMESYIEYARALAKPVTRRPESILIFNVSLRLVLHFEVWNS